MATAVCTTTTTATTNDRAVHLLDIENLLQGPWATVSQIEATLARYVALSGWRSGDLVSIAANPKLGLRVRHLAPVECSVRTRLGKNGADLALIETMPVEFVIARADRLVIGSGDGIFVPYAEAARSAGLDVTVVANPGGVHRNFRRLDITIIEFDGLGPFAA